MARIEITVSGVPVDDSQAAKLQALLENTIRAMAGTGFRPPISVLLGHHPMVIAEGLTEDQQREVGAAVLAAVIAITQAPIDPTDHGKVEIVFAPETEREAMLQEAVDLIRLRDDRLYTLERVSADPAAADAIQRELEQIEREIDNLRERLNAMD